MTLRWGALLLLLIGLASPGCRRVEYLVDGALTGDAAADDANLTDATDPDASPELDTLVAPDMRPLLPCHPAVSANCSGGMCQIPAGCFMMGSPATEPCREPDEDYHEVTLNRAFAIGQLEVTHKDWRDLMGSDPPALGFPSCGDNCPVEGISWHEAVQYANARSAAESLQPCYSCSGDVCEVDSAFVGGSQTIYDCPGYRLPTEAEWEYAYRAGTSWAFPSGPLLESCAGDANADAIGWNDANSGGTVHVTGQKLANGWGVYDMGGNVWEWVHDYYEEHLGEQPVIDPVGAAGPGNGALKGGCWDTDAATMRAARRRSLNRDRQDSTWIGFRIARSLP